MSRRPRRIVAPLLALVATASPLGAQQQGEALRSRTVAEDLQLFSQVLNQIRVNHPDTVDLHELFMAAIEGMVQAADPHSYVLPARRLSPEKERAMRAGQLDEVPIRFSFIGGAPVVVSALAAVAAQGLDILPGDELVRIDGQPVTARSADELDIVLAGRAGTSVALTFERQRLDGSVVTLTRAVRRVKQADATAAPLALMLDARTGYLRLTAFSSDAARDVRAGLQSLDRQGMERLVLDLRDNGGGRVDQAASIAGEFLQKDAVVYHSEGRRADLTATVRVEGGGRRPGRAYPLVVLVNQGTASAAELLAGALQDHDRALIVGAPTFGKALLMRGFPLTDGSLMMLVVGQVKTPCGRTVQRAYRDVTQREYYRMAQRDRETAGLPSCTTAGGRTVYGGDGIRPDLVLPPSAPRPPWIARLIEQDLTLRWVGSYLDAVALPPLDSLLASAALPASAVADFRAFATRNGIDELPTGAEADRALNELLLRTVVRARWGAPGDYRLTAMSDPAIAAAVAAFDQAASLLLLEVR